MPSRFIMHLPDFEHKAVLLAEGQSALDPRSSLTYQVRLSWQPIISPGPTCLFRSRNPIPIAHTSITCVAQIYVGPGPKGDSVAALKRLPRDGGGETVYQLLYCDEKKGTCTLKCIHSSLYI